MNTSADSSLHPVSRIRGWLIALSATLAMSISFLDRQTLAVLAPTVTEAFALSNRQYGMLQGAFHLPFMLVIPFAGRWLDRIGARRGLLASILAWSAVAAMHALAPSFAVLVALRMLLGVTESPSFPGAAQAIRRALPTGDRSTGFGLLFTGTSIGASLAAPLAIWWSHHYGWRMAFLGTALTGLLWVPLWLVATFNAPGRRVLDPSGAPEPRSSAPSERASKLLRHPAVLRSIVLLLLVAPVGVFSLAWFSKYLVSTHHLTQDDLASYLWLPPLAFDLGAVSFGFLASRSERKRRVEDGPGHRGLMLAAALITSTIALLPLASSPGVALAFAAVSMLGNGGLFALMTGDMLARVPTEKTSSASALTGMAQGVAFMISAPLIGWSVDRTHSYTPSLIALGVLTVVGISAWLLYPLRAARAA